MSPELPFGLSGFPLGKTQGLGPVEAMEAARLWAGPLREWRVTPRCWPQAFSVARIDPDGDGLDLRLEAADAMVRAAAAAGARLTPALEQADLALLGRSEIVPQAYEPRAHFLWALAERYDGDGGDDLPDPPGIPIDTWQIGIDVNATPQGPRPDDARQMIADVAAILSANPGAGVIADIGEFSTGADQAIQDRIRSFSRGPAASSLKGLGVDFVLERPSLDEAVEGLVHLRGAVMALPIWIHGVRVGPDFDSDSPAAAAGAGEAWDAERTRAAYVSAVGAYCRAALFGGKVFWDDALTTGTRLAGQGAPPTATARAAGRLSSLLRPYYRAEIRRDGPVYLLTFNRPPEPASYVVFWDWAADPDYRPGKSREYTPRLRQNLYRATPLVDDPPLWGAPRELNATKLGLRLELGRSPLYIERAHIGRGVPVSLGVPRRLAGPPPTPEAGEAAPK
jgi:hypothetical protein